MNTAMLDAIEWWVGRIGALAVMATLAIALFGLWRGLSRPKRRATGMAHWILRPPFFLLISVLYFGACFILWRPLPLTLPLPVRVVALVLGGLLFFPGLALYLWARLTMGHLYGASCSLGAQLHADHQLITHGPFAFVRHPMYLAVFVVALGGTLLYRTWTLLLNLVIVGSLVARAKREEEALAAEFGDQWVAYSQRVPGWIPRLGRWPK